MVICRTADGYGELWLRIADAVKDHVEYGKCVKGINFDTKTVTTGDGGMYRADTIVTTIPWPELEDVSGMPEDIRAGIRELKYSSVQTEYHGENLETPCQWIYCPAPEVPYHRILVRHNFCLGEPRILDGNKRQPRCRTGKKRVCVLE